MIKVKTLINLLKKNKSDFFSGVPDSVLKEFSYSLKDKNNPLIEKIIKEYPFLKKSPITYFLIAPLIISIFLLSLITYIPSFPIKFFLFSIFAFLKGFLLTLARDTVSNETIIFGLLSTISIFDT